MSFDAPPIEPQRFGSGHAVRRLEDPALLRGAGQYTDDMQRAAQAQLVFLRSPYPHAGIRSIDTEAARAMPGVLAIYTGADLVTAGVKPLPTTNVFTRADGSPGTSPPRRALAHERVRFVGEPVAAVVAETLQQARDAAEAVMVDYEELPAVVDMRQAIGPGAPVLHDAAPDNIVAETRYGDAAAADAAFARAAHVVCLSIFNQRVVALTLEPRAMLAEIDPGDGRLVLHSSSQMPSAVRDIVAGSLGLPRESVRVKVGDVGGGFGMKTGIYPEDLATAWCAHQLRRPVKWTADRSEEFLASAHGRDVDGEVAMALDADGRVLALRVSNLANMGGYATPTGAMIQLRIGPWVTTSVYDIALVDLRYRAVLTNTAPTGSYRGAGRPEAIFAIERLFDEAARVSGIDRIELRRRNFIRPAQMPYTNAMGQVYDSGAFERLMDRGLALADWNGFEARHAAARARGRLRGLGIATFLEWTGGNALEERVTVTALADGTIEVFSAVNAMGQGIATSLAQLVVDVFGVPIGQVRVVLGDTDRGDGFGTAGSRSLFTGGSSMHVGAHRFIEHARRLAAESFEVAPDDVTYGAGRLQVAGTDLSIGLGELAARQPGGRIFTESTSRVGGPSWPNGCHVCEVEIDPGTGELEIVAYSSVNDIGRVVNPMIVQGQLDGAALQGIGQALMEHMVYDRETGQPLTGSLMDYAAPRADALRIVMRSELDESTPCLTNPLGVKGVGELGTIGSMPAVVNATADALARSGRADLAAGLQMPLRAPDLWRALRSPAGTSRPV
ncbi:MAG: xanthine dehydrogenase family protein molybdopterin-binding subunit [Burkholderiales bacterium]|nr:xanthine dehydrogenase family protein molybdopterin-binding subunit [Burkholderiales bacterium]